MQGALYALMAAALFGLSNVLGRLGIARSSVYVSVIWNILASVPVFALVFIVGLATDGASFLGDVDLRAAPYFAGVGLVSDFLARLALFASAAHLGASRATAFRVLSPIFTAAAGFLLLGERLSATVIGGIALILVGILVVTWDSLALRAGPAGAAAQAAAGRTARAGSPRAARTGLILGILSALFFGAGDVLRKQGVAIEPSPLLGAAVSSGVGMVLCAVLGMAHGTLKGALRPGPAFPYVAGAGVGTGIAVLCLLASMQTLPVAVATTINGTQALFAILFGWWLDRKAENITWLLGAGALLTVLGLRLVLLG